MPPPTLPDPTWSAGATLCVSCGYSLEGMPAPGTCPECGAAFESRQLVLYGVANLAAEPSPTRRAMWIASIVDGVILWLFWPVILFTAWPVLVAMILGLVAMIGWLLATSRRTRGGVERFVITPAGIARLPFRDGGDGTNLGSVLIPFGPATELEWRQIGPFWARIRLRSRQGRGPSVIFDAGVRCPTEQAEGVCTEIRSRLERNSAAQGAGEPSPRA